MVVPEIDQYPLCNFFLGGYLKKVNSDPENFPPNEFPGLFQRYEDVFSSGLRNLGISKEELKRRSEFNFDSGNTVNLESGVAVLRVTEALRLRGFINTKLVNPPKGMP